MKQLKGFFAGLAIAITLTATAATVYNYFPPPGMTYTPTTGLVVGTATGGPQGAGTVNTQGLFVNGTSVDTGGTVTSVGLTVPSWETVSGSPVTSSGTLAITAAGGQTANSVLASPNGSSGALSVRALVGADIPPINLGVTTNGGVLSTSILSSTNGGTSNGFFSVTGPTTATRTFTFPNASATVLTSNAAVTVPQGGTGATAFTTHGVVVGEGTSSFVGIAALGADTLLQGQSGADPAAVSVNNCGSSTQALSYSTSTHTFGCQTISTGTGSVTSLTSGTAIVLSPSTITTTGSISLDTTASPTITGAWTFSTAPAFNTGFSGAVNINGLIQGLLENLSAGGNAQTSFSVSNGINAVGMFITSTGFTGGAPYTGAPTGQFAYIFGPASTSVPLSISAGAFEQIRIVGGAAGSVNTVHNAAYAGNYLAFGSVVNNGTTCTIGSNANFGITSCTRTGTGAITLTFTNTSTLTATCMGSVNATAGSVGINTRNTGTAGVTSYNAAGSATDENFDFVCF